MQIEKEVCSGIAESLSGEGQVVQGFAEAIEELPEQPTSPRERLGLGRNHKGECPRGIREGWTSYTEARWLQSQIGWSICSR